jgi:hypothetical protein
MRLKNYTAAQPSAGCDTLKCVPRHMKLVMTGQFWIWKGVQEVRSCMSCSYEVPGNFSRGLWGYIRFHRVEIMSMPCFKLRRPQRKHCSITFIRTVCVRYVSSIRRNMLLKIHNEELRLNFVWNEETVQVKSAKCSLKHMVHNQWRNQLFRVSETV